LRQRFIRELLTSQDGNPIDRVGIAESNKKLAMGWPEHQRVNYAMGARGRYIGRSARFNVNSTT